MTICLRKPQQHLPLYKIIKPLFFITFFLLSFFTKADTLSVCYHYGCNKVANFEVSAATKNDLANLFNNVKSATDEQKAIQRAVQLLYLEAGKTTPIHQDKGGNFNDGSVDGKMDCVDHSQNDTKFLQYLERNHWLRYFKVMPIKWRAPWILDLHYASQLQNTEDNSLWTLDSWFLDFGHLPVFVPYQTWKEGYTP